jgi:hypothetical protein
MLPSVVLSGAGSPLPFSHEVLVGRPASFQSQCCAHAATSQTPQRRHRQQTSIRHDEVGRALYRSALLMGLRAQHEVKGLDPDSDLRPDVMLTLPGRQILTDVAIVHPLAPGAVRDGVGLRTLGRARGMEAQKRLKYTRLSSLRGYEQLPFVVETCGGVGPSADVLMKAMADASEEHLRMWPKEAVLRHLVSSAAIAVQRGNAIAYLDGYEQTLRAMREAAAGEGERRRKTKTRVQHVDAAEEAGGGDEGGDGEVVDGEMAAALA